MIPNSLFYGNGLNLITDGNPTWNDLLQGIAPDCKIKNVPNTMKYESIILSTPYQTNHVICSGNGSCITSANGAILINTKHTENNLKREIAQRLKMFKSNDIYEEVAKMNFNHYMTSNYDEVLLNHFSKKENPDKGYQEEEHYNIRRHYYLSNGNSISTYWPLHGTIEVPLSIMLGLDHYCGTIHRMKQYIMGEYDYKGTYGVVPKLEERLREGIQRPLSWIDLFFISNVHIIGFKLDYAETDIWWLLDKRNRMIRKLETDSLVRNRIFYYATSDDSDRFRLLEGFGVEIVKPSKFDKSDYEGMYISLLKQMRDLL